MSRGLTKAYFNGLQAALHKAKISEPVLVLDRQRLNANIDELIAGLPPGMGYRIVAKSLPIPALLSHVAKRARTDRMMSFNTRMTRQLLDHMPKADILHGKPFPVAACAQFLKSLPKSRARQLGQIQWLIDHPDRLQDYARLAKKTGIKLRINLEIDVGLHRGGLTPGATLDKVLRDIASQDHLHLSGFMGYEPHLPKLPDLQGWSARAKRGAWKLYEDALNQARNIFGDAHVAQMTRNMGGSPTLRMYKTTELANEMAAGSALVKPSDFDTPLLSVFEPASFIAAPVLKVTRRLTVPAIEFADGLLGDPKPATCLFTHGGYWMASPVFPKRLEYSQNFGRSSNQDFLTGPVKLAIQPDDFVFLRPHQSEAVFLQFPRIVVYDGRRICDNWQPLTVSA